LLIPRAVSDTKRGAGIVSGRRAKRGLDGSSNRPAAGAAVNLNTIEFGRVK